MTLLEVVLAITVLMIGIGFIVQGDNATRRYQEESQIRQQMLFYAAGQLEILLQGGAVIQGKDLLPAGKYPMDNFAVSTSTVENVGGNGHLEQIEVTVSDPPAQPVTLSTYRVK